MLVQLLDSVVGTPVYINPAYVVTLRPDPADPDHISIIKIRDGESIRVRGGDKEVADKLARAVEHTAGNVRGRCRTLGHDWLSP